MIITTETGRRIKTEQSPEWSEFHKRFYVFGFRFIASRNAFSKTSVLHNFKSFTIEGGAQ